MEHLRKILDVVFAELGNGQVIDFDGNGEQLCFERLALSGEMDVNVAPILGTALTPYQIHRLHAVEGRNRRGSGQVYGGGELQLGLAIPMPELPQETPGAVRNLKRFEAVGDGTVQEPAGESNLISQALSQGQADCCRLPRSRMPTSTR